MSILKLKNSQGIWEEIKTIKGEKGEKGADGSIKYLIVAELPETGELGTMYLVPNPEVKEQNKYLEYIWTGSGFELIGDQYIKVDLSDYVKKTDKEITNKELLSNKVTSISSSSTDTEYPSAKAVYTIVGDIETLLEEI